MICPICLKKLTTDQTHSHYHDRCLRDFFGSTKIPPELDFTREQFFTEKARAHSIGLSISGVQQKLSIAIENNKLIVTSIDGRYILKPSPESYKELSANEQLCLTLSKEFGIKTADSALISFQGGELCLLIKRFDRDDGKKIHQEDLVQAMNIPKGGEGKYSLSYEEAGKFIKRHCSLAVVKDFFERVFFNFMIGNGDFHLKNISLREFDGIMQLTPNYDLVNTALYQDPEHFALDLLIDDELTPQRKILGNYSKYDFDELGSRLGLNHATLDSIYRRFFEREVNFQQLISNSYLSSDFKDLYRKTLEGRKTLFLQKV